MYLCVTGISSEEWYKQKDESPDQQGTFRALPERVVLVECRVWEDGERLKVTAHSYRS